jgi:hypothetical protein
MEGFLKPDILDLEPLPLKAFEIVPGVVNKLVGRAGRYLIETVELQYPSTALIQLRYIRDDFPSRHEKSVRFLYGHVRFPICSDGSCYC